MDKGGEGEINPTKLDCDSQLSQLGLDSISCEYFIVTSWKTSSEAIKANQWKSWLFCFSAN